MKQYGLIIIIAAFIGLLSLTYFFVINLSAVANLSLPALNPEAAVAPVKIENQISFAFAGDVMLGRNVGDRFQKNNFTDLFKNFDAGVFENKNIAWLNLEGPISDKDVAQNPKDKSLVFNFSRQAVEALKYLKITTAGLANNHTANQGAAGLKKTRELLEQAGIEANGDPNKAEAAGVKHFKQGKLTVALVAAHVLYNTKGVEEVIKAEKKNNNFVIVLPHWGNEYQITHSAAQEKLARLWIAAGADLIIGTHPHVVQDAQILGGKPVFYSLGNFIFDQMFSAETQQGLILTGSVGADKLKITLVPVISRNMKPEIARGPERQKIIDRICRALGNYCRDGRVEL